jgi:hypothetical protein
VKSFPFSRPLGIIFRGSKKIGISSQIVRIQAFQIPISKAGIRDIVVLPAVYIHSNKKAPTTAITNGLVPFYNQCLPTKTIYYLLMVYEYGIVQIVN